MPHWEVVKNIVISISAAGQKSFQRLFKGFLSIPPCPKLILFILSYLYLFLLIRPHVSSYVIIYPHLFLFVHILCSIPPCPELQLVIDVVYEPSIGRDTHRELYSQCRVGILRDGVFGIWDGIYGILDCLYGMGCMHCRVTQLYSQCWVGFLQSYASPTFTMLQDFLITSHSLRVRLTREGKEFPLPPSSSGNLANLSLLVFIEKLDRFVIEVYVFLLSIAERCQQQLAILLKYVI